MTTDEKIGHQLSRLQGSTEYFRECLQSDAIMERVCQFAELEAERRHCEPWNIIGEVTGHGSGVSSAIYEVYKK